jgi:Ca2+-binding RTX toxin-like protein
MKRTALILVIVLSATVALGPGPAGAVNGTTAITSHPQPGGGYVLKVTAAKGQQNYITVNRDCPLDKECLVVQDGAGIEDHSSKCGPGTSHFTTCRLKGLRGVEVRTGDGNDTVIPYGRVKVTVWGGGGADTFKAGGGNQRLLGGDGPDHIRGGPGKHDLCDGQAGNDNGGSGCETEISL